MILEILAGFNAWWFENIVKNGGYFFLLLMVIVIPLQISTWRLRMRNEKRWRMADLMSRGVIDP